MPTLYKYSFELVVIPPNVRHCSSTNYYLHQGDRNVTDRGCYKVTRKAGVCEIRTEVLSGIFERVVDDVARQH